jgi:hypothetical protein
MQSKQQKTKTHDLNKQYQRKEETLKWLYDKKQRTTTDSYK